MIPRTLNVQSAIEFARKLGDQFQRSHFGQVLIGFAWDFVICLLVIMSLALPQLTGVFTSGPVKHGVDQFVGYMILGSYVLCFGKGLLRQFLSKSLYKEAHYTGQPSVATRNIVVWLLRLENSVVPYGVTALLSVPLALFVEGEQLRLWGWLMVSVVFVGLIATCGAQRMYSEVHDTDRRKALYGSSSQTSVQLVWLYAVIAVAFSLLLLGTALK